MTNSIIFHSSGHWITIRVSNKGEIKNTHSGSNVFNFHALDQTGEISVTAFRLEVEKFHPMIQVVHVFLIF
jgi:hypothetical protein